MKGICVLGATGSIGTSTLDVISRHTNKYKVIALTTNTNIDILYTQCVIHHPETVVVVDPDKAELFKDKIQKSAQSGTNITDIIVRTGAKALEVVATLDNVDSVMAAIVGSAGLLPNLAAAKSGKTILLANKEALVMSGDIFMQAIQQSGANLLPIDSEHNAIFQCMPSGYTTGESAKSVRRILLTASGGPFRETPLKELPNVTVEQAINHPKWNMGRKISVDSATMMNKGLELIEACLLFKLSANDIHIVIHKQSIIHSMVDYVDGSVLAQMGNPDMRVPIAHAMAWPERFASGVKPLDIFSVKQMDFEPPCLIRFPCIRLAYKAVSYGGIMPTVLNAANEVAVSEFINKRIKFTDIAIIIEQCMAEFSADPALNLETILQADKQAREQSYKIIEATLH